MTARQKEMSAIKEQIAKLEERLEYLSKLPESTIEEEFLYSFEDFPRFRNHIITDAIYYHTKYRLLWEEGADYVEEVDKVTKRTYRYLAKPLKYEDLTVKDLISCSEEMIARYRGVGKAKMEELKNWMEKHDLHFVR